MATYCSERDLKDVFPSIDEFDTKTPIYGWVVVSGDKYAAHNSGLVTQLFVDGESLGDAQSAHTDLNVEGEWFYNSTDDVLYYYSASNPNDKLIESGEDWATLKTRYMANGSAYLDSRLDSHLPREQFKDQDGNYDYIIRRTSALLTASFLIRASDPTSEIASALWEEANDNLESLNSGSTKLSWQVSGDSAKGSLSELGTISGALRIVDTRGEYSGIYDKIGVEITTAGRIGVATYSVWTGDSDYTGVERMDIDATANLVDEKINGQYQSLAGGLQIRFSGDIADAAVLADKWQVEVYGRQETVDIGTPGSIRMTRRSKRVATWQ